MTNDIDTLFQSILGRPPTQQERTMYVSSDWEKEDIERHLSIVKLSYEYFGEVVPAVQIAFESDNEIDDIIANWQGARKQWINNVVEEHFLRDNASQDERVR